MPRRIITRKEMLAGMDDSGMYFWDDLSRQMERQWQNLQGDTPQQMGIYPSPAYIQSLDDLQQAIVGFTGMPELFESWDYPEVYDTVSERWEHYADGLISSRDMLDYILEVLNAQGIRVENENLDAFRALYPKPNSQPAPPKPFSTGGDTAV